MKKKNFEFFQASTRISPLKRMSEAVDNLKLRENVNERDNGLGFVAAASETQQNEGAHFVSETTFQPRQHIASANFSLPFSKWDPNFWFKDLEDQFAYRKIVDDEAKYWIVRSNLGDDLRVLSDAIKTHPSGHKYSSLKEIVLKKFSKTPEQKIQELFSGVQLDDRLPSELFHHLVSLSQDSVATNVIYTWWKEQLPGPVQMHLTGTYSAYEEARILASADNVFKIYKKNTVSINKVSATDPSDQFERLIASLNAIGIDRNSRPRPRSPSRYRNDSRPRNSSRDRKDKRKEGGGSVLFTKSTEQKLISVRASVAGTSP